MTKTIIEMGLKNQFRFNFEMYTKITTKLNENLPEKKPFKSKIGIYLYAISCSFDFIFKSHSIFQ